MPYNVIAIEREYASGGSEIGEKLAALLKVPCHGMNILSKAAEKLGASVSALSELEETVSGNLFSLDMFTRLPTGEMPGLNMAQRLALAETDVICELAMSPCVIVGRCAVGALANNRRALKVFMHADYEARTKRAIDIYGIDPKQAEATLRRFDRRRANFFKATAGADWQDANMYHMILNTGLLGVDAAVSLIAKAVSL